MTKHPLLASALAATLGLGSAAFFVSAADKPDAAKPADTKEPKAGEPRKTASGLQITVTEEAQHPGAQSGDVIWVYYTGKLTDGKQFDSNVGKDPFKVLLGAGRVIKGWDEGLVGMKIGEKRQLVIPPALGYGAEGAGADIPPNATLVFDVEMVGIARPKPQK